MSLSLSIPILFFSLLSLLHVFFSSPFCLFWEMNACQFSSFFWGGGLGYDPNLLSGACRYAMTYLNPQFHYLSLLPSIRTVLYAY